MNTSSNQIKMIDLGGSKIENCPKRFLPQKNTILKKSWREGIRAGQVQKVTGPIRDQIA